jgi:protein-disulfide isomerase
MSPARRLLPRAVLLTVLPAVLPAVLASAIPASAAQADSFSPAQRQEIVQVVREALKTDPSILADAIAALRAQEGAQEAAAQGNALRANRHALDGTPGDQIAGNPNGSVTLYEFYDPRCPWCRRMVDDVARLTAAVPSLRVVYKVIPILGPNSTLEARAILAAAHQGGYLKLQHALMTDAAAPSLDRIRAVARTAGLNDARLAADMNAPESDKQIAAQLALAQTLRINGTPSFVVGDKLLPGAVSYDTLHQLVTQQAR